MLSYPPAFLIIGAVLVVIGLTTGLKYRWRHPRTYIYMLVGLFLMGMGAYGPLSQNIKDSGTLQKLDCSRIVRISIRSPENQSGKTSPLVRQPITIVDRPTIDRICDSIHKSKYRDQKLNKVKQIGIITLSFRDDNTIFNLVVNKADTLTTLSIYSNDKEIRYEGCWYASGLGALIDSLDLVQPAIFLPDLPVQTRPKGK